MAKIKATTLQPPRLSPLQWSHAPARCISNSFTSPYRFIGLRVLHERPHWKLKHNLENRSAWWFAREDCTRVDVVRGRLLLSGAISEVPKMHFGRCDLG